jgi:carbon-monoxide dehydrogenase medium subunit
MKPVAFDYFDPTTVDEALALLRTHGEGAKALAGGQSLVPLMNFRLARPQALIDLNRVATLDYVRAADGMLAIGALTRQHAVEFSADVRARCPLLAEAVPFIGHAAIRSRGTVGGSVAHADPAAELPTVVAALEGTLVARGPGGERTIAARDFFVSYLTTALAPDELLVEVRLPVAPPRTGAAFVEVSRRHGDFALVAAAAQVTLAADGVCERVALALGGVGAVPFAAGEDARRLVGETPTEGAYGEIGRRVAARVEPDSDLHASAAYRTDVAAVLTRRALAQAVERARAVVRATTAAPAARANRARETGR